VSNFRYLLLTTGSVIWIRRFILRRRRCAFPILQQLPLNYDTWRRYLSHASQAATFLKLKFAEVSSFSVLSPWSLCFFAPILFKHFWIAGLGYHIWSWAAWFEIPVPACRFLNSWAAAHRPLHCSKTKLGYSGTRSQSPEFCPLILGVLSWAVYFGSQGTTTNLRAYPTHACATTTGSPYQMLTLDSLIEVSRAGPTQLLVYFITPNWTGSLFSWCPPALTCPGWPGLILRWAFRYPAVVYGTKLGDFVARIRILVSTALTRTS
jgi:hypothetical protein